MLYHVIYHMLLYGTILYCSITVFDTTVLEGAGGLVCRYHTCYLISRVMCGVSKWAISGVSYVDIPYLDPDLSK